MEGKTTDLGVFKVESSKVDVGVRGYEREV